RLPMLRRKHSPRSQALPGWLQARNRIGKAVARWRKRRLIKSTSGRSASFRSFASSDPFWVCGTEAGDAMTLCARSLTGLPAPALAFNKETPTIQPTTASSLRYSYATKRSWSNSQDGPQRVVGATLVLSSQPLVLLENANERNIQTIGIRLSEVGIHLQVI